MRIRIDEPGDARSQSVSFSGPVGHATAVEQHREAMERMHD